jgi:hypothetical protein
MRNNKITQNIGNFSGLSATLSIVFCYGTLVVVSVFSAIGISLNVNEGLWAGAIVLFALLTLLAVGAALLTLLAVGANYCIYKKKSPILVSTIGVILISWVMFVSFNRIIEIIGFIGLIIAAIWDRHLKKRSMSNIPVVDKQ